MRMRMITIPRFTRYPTRQLDSLSGLVAVGHRCGVYVLQYSDGSRYVGMAVDVVRRYAQHRHAHGVIDSVEFAEVPEGDLAEVEIAMIHHESSRGQVRNRLHASEFVGTSALDPVVTRDDQLAWLAGDVDAVEDPSALRPDDAKQRAARQARYAQLVAEPLGGIATAVLSQHVELTIPCPRQTERRFWSVSAMPSTSGGGRFATLSVGKAETIFVYPELLEDEWWVVGGRINVAASALPADVLSGSLDRPGACVDPDTGGYESTGSDLAGLRFRITEDLNGYYEVMGWPGVLDGARLLTVRLMRKGASLQGRWHNFPLADVILDDVDWPWQ